MNDAQAPRVLPGLRALSLAALRAGVARLGAGDAWIACDASLGSWRARHLATELAAQVGVALHVAQDPREALAQTGSLPSLAEIIGAGVDAEARGDEGIVRALEDARAVARGVKSTGRSGVVAIAPRGDRPLDRGDRRFLGFLADTLRADGIPLIVAVADAGAAPAIDGWEVGPLEDRDPGAVDPALAGKSTWSLLPGLAEPAITEQLSKGTGPFLGHSLPGGLSLVAPELRPAERPAPRGRYDELAAATAGTWVEMYAQVFGNNLFVEGSALARAAWREFAAGGVEVALRLLARAAECAVTPAARAVFASQAQGMRIAALRFDEAAAEPAPELALAPDIRGFLLEAKGWGMVLTGQAAEAESLLAEARALAAAEEGSVSYLYLMNISALAKLRQNAFDEAMALELHIQERAGALEPEDHRLTYVNALNLARLYRRDGDRDRARALYERAFATSIGTRSEADRVYVNATLAMLAQEDGRAADADRAWMRAALHWLSATVPEAIGGRAASAIVGRAVRAGDEVVELVSQALLSRWRETGVSLPAVTGAPAFASTGDSGRLARFVTGDGWSVGLGLRGPSAARPARVRGAWDALRAVVWGRVRSDAPGSLFSPDDTVLVDDRFGREMPLTELEAIEACARLGASQAWLGGGLVALDAAAYGALQRRAKLAIGPAVAAMSHDGDDACLVRFKRQRPPLRIGGVDARVLRAASGREEIFAFAARVDVPVDEVLARVRALRERRVVDLTITEETCAAAGIK